MAKQRKNPTRTFLSRLIVAAACVTLPWAVGLGDAQAQPTMVIRTTDHAFTVPATVRAGFVTVQIINDGKDLHHAQIVRLNPGVTTAQALGALRQGLGAFLPLVVGVGGPGLVAPGGRASVSLTLQPGDHLLLCFVESSDGTPHVASGMVKPLRVTGAVAARPAPSVAGELVLHDFRFAMPQTLNGRETYRVVNQGVQLHEAIFLRLAPGKTVDDVKAFFSQHPASGPPPAMPVGGVQGLSRGGVNYHHPNLPAGEYVVICFIPDPGSGKPHFELGMISAVTVR
ncbi:MAG: hypothetical protein QN174_06000 [Armatimonadota bacterium]|nr:hypothetical protein [Armatimonadota bacterium]MDR7421960.1 hypothetical protein [Armatimonadota bacterium]MDR7453504.1 hypothetical protein [Armatimonadota bacterium]MDR7456969.1 hypothetical protein [Armatimonadota bacterium]MDR7496492.1 hypothetical protein [Armatimonadota bacterium]